ISSNPLDLDSAGFDSKKYLKKILVEQGVKGLLHADAELISAVRQIDGDMKTMVYENYSKFISATETIGRMKEDADFMDAEMAKLSRRISDISERTKAVDRGLAQRRERIQRLSSEQKTMRRLQLLFDLPDRLNQLISQGRFVDAAREWSRTKPLLEHYRQLGVFAGVENDGRQIMASVEATIWNRWRGSDTDVREGAECASLLVLLHPERAAELWREYLDVQGVKNRECRQAALDRAFVSPRAAAAAADFPALDQPLPTDASNAGTRAADLAGACVSRIERFNAEYLPVWSSLVIGFASQFVSPAGSGLLDDVATQDQPPAQTRAQARKSAGGERTMSLLEATTEGTVVGLLSPLADSAQGQQSDRQRQRLQASKRKSGSAGLRVVGWQAMSTQDLAQAQAAFAQHLHEWCSDYEFIVDSLLDFPDDATTANLRVYLDQLDAFVGCVGAYPILARIGGLHDCVYRVATRWQERLIEGALQGVVRDMIERLEFYFDPNIDAHEVSAVPRRSSVSRHQRTLSAKSNGSQGSGNNHQRSGSVLSATWSAAAGAAAAAAAADRSMSYNSASGTPQSPLPFHTVSSGSGINTGSGGGGGSSRGLAHARAVSSAFEALSNVPTQPIAPASLSLSPSRPGTLRRARHQRTHSNAVMDLFDSQDDAPSQPRRSLSLRRVSIRRYRPWLVGSVNRNAPLHVFLADIESWLIQQILERVNPLLESVVQHYLDIEASQMLDDGESRAILPLQVATRMRQSFIKTLDRCLDNWMSNWMPDAFLYSAMVSPVHGTRVYVEKSMADSPMSQLGMTTVSDPVSSLLLARFAVDFELTLTQSIYQLCEHAISILPEDSAVRQRGIGDQSADSSAEASITNLLAHRPGDMPNDPLGSDRLQSITAASAARADSMASAVSNSRRGTLGGTRPGNHALLSTHRAAHSAKWHSVAERLVRHFVMTVGQDISSDYLRIRPYDFGTGDVAGDSRHQQQQQQHGVVSVSEVWLSICQWMRQVEDDTNALFYDPVFSDTLKALENSNALSGDFSGSQAPNRPGTQRQQQALATSGGKGASGVGSISGYNNPALLHAHILSNIDRLFAERVDVFPKTVTPLASGQILFHLAMQIIKTALESIRLKPIVLHTVAQYQQVVVDATFVRSWMLRYTGIAPDLLHLSEPPQLPQLGQTFVGEPRRRSSRTKLAQSASASASASAGGGGGGGNFQSVSSAAVNERDAQAVQNLIDDWIGSAKALALDRAEPDSKLVDRVVLNAWMAAYFGNPAEHHGHAIAPDS
ncbi:hypothetical protein LPJ75_001807, partial [Coemansia sp. RSA 2598]